MWFAGIELVSVPQKLQRPSGLMNVAWSSRLLMELPREPARRRAKLLEHLRAQTAAIVTSAVEHPHGVGRARQISSAPIDARSHSDQHSSTSAIELASQIIPSCTAAAPTSSTVTSAARADLTDQRPRHAAAAGPGRRARAAA